MTVTFNRGDHVCGSLGSSKLRLDVSTFGLRAALPCHRGYGQIFNHMILTDFRDSYGLFLGCQVCGKRLTIFLMLLVISIPKFVGPRWKCYILLATLTAILVPCTAHELPEKASDSFGQV